MKKYFVYEDEKSSKFWEITMTGNTIATRYGKIGSDGQIKEKQFADEDAAQKEFEKLVKEKTKKGYIEERAENISVQNPQKKKYTTLKDFKILAGKELIKKYDILEEYDIESYPISSRNYHKIEVDPNSEELDLDTLLDDVDDLTPEEFYEKYKFPSTLENNNNDTNFYILEKDAYFKNIDFDTFSGNNNHFLFLGNIEVEEFIMQENLNYGPTILVKGNVKAKNLFAGGSYIRIKGNVEIEQTIWGEYNDGSLITFGELDAEVCVIGNHDMYAYEGYNVEYMYDEEGELLYQQSQKVSIKDIFHKNIYNLEEEGEEEYYYLNHENAIEYMRAGKSIVKNKKNK